MQVGNLEEAINKWRQALGANNVITDAQALAPYSICTTPTRRIIPAAILPGSADDVKVIVLIAARYNIPLYPISTGHNWGYGSANPVVDGCVVVDLSKMNRILDFDAELGIVTLEPGVTQGQLRAYLDESKLAFLVPVTGAGPTCSLVGNTLERGYGITPYPDHFGAMTSLQAVLPDGTLYRGALTEMGGALVDKTFKWGIGPYLDGLFCQGAFGIVTQMTIALAPAHERMMAFFFRISNDCDLERIVDAERDVLMSLGSMTSSINLMNPLRMLSMLIPYPDDPAIKHSISEEDVRKLAHQYGVGAWSGVGAIYGDKEMVRAAIPIIKKKLGRSVTRLIFMASRHTRVAKRILSFLPGQHMRRFWTFADRLDATLQILEGRPSEVALPLAYWKSGQPAIGSARNPALDGCGLIWYAPLVPMKASAVRTLVRMVSRVCSQYDIDPLITLTSLSHRCFDCTVPILYDKTSPEAEDAAMACFQALFVAGQEHGFLPYRLGTQAMDLIASQNTPSWRLGQMLKTAVDPSLIISPGRYSIY
ncbi:MAG: FAD-binding oxidoreductase [Nitrosospira sp.]